jgi:outer membrane autotransporter protein
LGARFGKVVRVNDCFALLPEFWANWEHEYINQSGHMNIGYAGSAWTFVADVNAIPQDRAVLGVGITTLIGQKWELGGRYEERLWDGGHNSQFAVQASLKF